MLTATKNLLVERLGAGVGAPVFDHVPDGQPPPAVIIDQIESEPVAVKDAAIAQFLTITIQIVAQGRSLDPFRAIVWSVRDRLDGWTPGAPGLAFGNVVVGQTSETTIEDGLTHVGTVQASLYVAAAD